MKKKNQISKIESMKKKIIKINIFERKKIAIDKYNDYINNNEKSNEENYMILEIKK